MGLTARSGKPETGNRSGEEGAISWSVPDFPPISPARGWGQSVKQVLVRSPSAAGTHAVEGDYVWARQVGDSNVERDASVTVDSSGYVQGPA